MPYSKLLYNKNEFDKDFISIIDTYEKSYLSVIYDKTNSISKEETTTAISEESSNDKKSAAPKKKRKFFENFFFSMD